MKKIIFLSILFYPLIVKAQYSYKLSFGVSTAYLNAINIPVNSNNIEDIDIKYYSPGLNFSPFIQFSKNKYQLQLNSFYNFTRYSWMLQIKDVGFVRKDVYWQNINNYGINLQLNIFHKLFYKYNARLYTIYGIGTSFRNFGAYKFEYSTEFMPNSGVIGAGTYFLPQSWDIWINSIQYSLGMKISAPIKKIGKIDYGVVCYWEPEPIPETWIQYKILHIDRETGGTSESIKTSTFELKQGYVSAFISFYLFNFGKEQNQGKFSRIIYKAK